MDATPQKLAVLTHPVWKHWRKILRFKKKKIKFLGSPHLHLPLGKPVGTSAILAQQHSLQPFRTASSSNPQGTIITGQAREALKLLLCFYQDIRCRAQKAFLNFQPPHWVWSRYTSHRCDETLFVSHYTSEADTTKVFTVQVTFKSLWTCQVQRQLLIFFTAMMLLPLLLAL